MEHGGWSVMNVRSHIVRVALCFLCASSELLLPSPLKGQDDHLSLHSRSLTPRFDHLTVADGLSQTTIYDLYQDRLGFMWFATQDGLNRYDGYSMVVYRRDPFDPTTLADNTISSVSEDRDGNLWVASGTGLHVMDRATEKFRVFRHDPSNPSSLADNVVRHVHQSRNGDLWVATRGGLERLDPESGTFRHYRHNLHDATTLSHSDVLRIFEDQDDRLWVLTANGLNLLNEDQAGFTHYLIGRIPNEAVSIPDFRVQQVLERPEEPGVLWVGTPFGLTRLDVQTGQTEQFLPDPGGPNNRIPDIVQDPITRHVLWLPVPGLGLARFDIRSGGFAIYGSDPNDTQSLSTNNAERVFVDRSGMIWVAAVGVGADKFNPATVGFAHYRSDPENPGTLPGSHVRGIHQEADGTLWVGTTDRQGIPRLSRMNQETGLFEHFRHEPGNENSLTTGRIRDITVDRTGSAWIATSGGGLDRLDTSGRFEHFRHDAGIASSLSNNVVRVVMVDVSGVLWVGTDGGLDRMQPGRPGVFTHYRHDEDDPNSLTDNRIRALFESQGGFIWIGTEQGVNMLDPVTGTAVRYVHDPDDPASLTSGTVLTVLERRSEPGIVWVGTFGGGLNRLDVATGQIRPFTQRHGLPNNTIYGILEDEVGRLWISTNHGLSRFDPDRETFRNYGLEIGLQSLEFNTTAYHRGPSGEMFFGGVNGMNAFFPSEITENTRAPEVVIVDIKLFNRSIRERGFELATAIPDLTEIELGASGEDVAIDYVGLHYQNPSQNQFSYILEGLNTEWVDAGYRRTASFTNLSPGRYTFRVRAANSDGVWNEEGAVIDLIIAPPWYRTWYAYILYALVLSAAIALAARIHKGRLIAAERERGRQRELEGAQRVEVAYDKLMAAQAQLVQAEKMASVGRLTSGIAHEIRNPLNFVNNFAALTVDAMMELKTDLEEHGDKLPPEVVAGMMAHLNSIAFNTQRVREHGQRADEILASMMQHSQSGQGEKHPTEINGLLKDYVRVVNQSMHARHPDLNVEVEEDYDTAIGRIKVIPQEIGKMLLNLVRNAYDSVRDKSSEDPEFKPRVRISTRGQGGVVEIRVSDNGKGIPKADLDKIFDPFFTTKPAGAGAGLGLSMSYEIVTGHGGTIEVESEDGEGATFVVRLPA